MTSVSRSRSVGGAQVHRDVQHGSGVRERSDREQVDPGLRDLARTLDGEPAGRLEGGATSGDAPPAELTRIFFLQLSVVGSTMGSRDELERLAQFMATTGVKPLIDSVVPLRDARTGFEKMHAGDLFGKVVFTT